MSNSSPIDVVDVEHTFFSDVDQAAHQSLTCAANLRDRMLKMVSQEHVHRLLPQMSTSTSAHQLGVSVFEKSLRLFQDFFTADHPSDLSVRVHVVSESINHVFLSDHMWPQFLSHQEINQSRLKSLSQFKEELKKLEELNAPQGIHPESDAAIRRRHLNQKINSPPVGNDVSVDQCINIFLKFIDDSITKNIENTLIALSLPRWKPLAVNVDDTLEIEVSKMEKQKLENYQRQQKAEHAPSPSRKM